MINVSLSPDGQSIRAAYMDVDGMSRPAPVAVWALASGQVVQRTTSTDTLPFASAFTPDGRWQYVTAKGHELTIWVLGKSPQKSTPNFQLPR